MCRSCTLVMIIIIQRIIVSVKYQLNEGEKDQTSELIIEVEMR